MKQRKTDVDLLGLTLVRFVHASQVETLFMIAQVVIIVQDLIIELKNFTILKNIKSNFVKRIQTELKAAIMVICVPLLILNLK
jgi:hypothetical protein